MAASKKKPPRIPEKVIAFETKQAWSVWLERHHATSTGLNLLIAKKGARTPSVTYAEALDVALAWGWIDGQKYPHDDQAWAQRFCPRAAKSPWSKINRDKAMALIAAKSMAAAGLEQVERAKRDGRWDSAYDGSRAATVPPDLEAALDKNARARQFFDALDRQNRYAILYRIQAAKKPETRAARIGQFVTMLAKHETIYPPRKKKNTTNARS